MNNLINKIKPYIYSLISTISFCFLLSISLNNVFVFLFIYIFLLFVFTYSKKKTNIYIVVLSVLLSLLILLGRYLVYISESNGFEFICKILLTPIGTFLVFNYLFVILFDLIDRYVVQDTNKKSIKMFIIGFICIFVLYIPLWIVEYPGIYYPDTLTQIGQARGLISLNNMNPLFHTFFLKIMYDFFFIFTKDMNICSFLVGLVQMIINSAIFSYVSLYVYRKTGSKILYVFSVLFFSLLSFNAFYSVTISKDSAYAAFTALFIICIDNLCHDQSRRNILSFLFVGICYSLLRSNGYYSLIVIIIVLLILVIRKIISYKVLLVTLITFMISSIIMFPGYSFIINNSQKSTSTTTPSTSEYKFRAKFLYVMPFQQVANVVVHGRELNEKEQWLIEEYIPLGKVPEVYNPILVDTLFNGIASNYKPTRGNISNIEYIKLWIELFLKYPQDYLEAYVNMTKYYFYPARYVNMYYIGIFNNQLGIKESSIISPAYKNTIEKIYDSQKEIPIIGSIFSPGVTVFILIITIFYCLSRKKYISLYCMTPLLVNFLILMAFVPLNDEFRYIYPVVVCLPIIISHLLSKDNLKKGYNETINN